MPNPIRILQIALDRTSDALTVVTPEGVMLFVNQTAAGLLGQPVDAIVGRLVWEVDGTMTIPRWKLNLERLRAFGSFEAERCRPGLDGDQFIEASAVLVADGGREFIVSRMRDVTAARRLERERREEEAFERERQLQQARLEGLGHRMNEIELVLREDGAVLDANDRAAAAYGRSHEALLGMNIRDLRAPSGQGEVRPLMDRVIREGGLRFRTEHQRADGSTFPVEVSSRSFRLGDTLYLHSLVRDLTEELRADAERRLLAGLISNMRDAVIVTDADLRVTRFAGAAEAVYGMTEAEVLGRNLLTGFAVEPQDAPIDDCVALARSGDGARTPHRWRRSDGKTVDLDVIISPLRDKDGAVQGFLMVSRDVSAQQATDRQLRESLRENESLVAELRDALQRVKTLSGLLPICAWCKRIRNDEGYWDRIEHYLSEHTDAQFTHGMCPECCEKFVRRG